MSHLELLVSALGGPGVVGPVRSRLDLVRSVRDGFRYEAVDSLSKAMDLHIGELTRLLEISAKTLHRRRATNRLEASESDRLVRVADIFARAQEVLGSADKARAWLLRPNRALLGEPPIALLDTQPGAEEVEDVLGRIEHGLFS